MFTGIIEAVGRIEQCHQLGSDLRVVVAVNQLDMGDVALGDSIAVNGTCLTVVRFDSARFTADVSAETVSLTAAKQWVVGTAVNLEKALTPTTRMGGHMVSGHIDGTAKVKQSQMVGGSLVVEMEAPVALARYIAKKGSITLDGISLTVNRVEGSCFFLNIVPHTAEVTNIGQWLPGVAVNLEVDLIARYLERLMLGDQAAEKSATESPSNHQQSNKGITAEFLAQHGFKYQ